MRRIAKQLIPRAKFRAIDGSTRLMFDTEHRDEQVHKYPLRGSVPEALITQKWARSINVVIDRYKDKPNSYFVIVTTPMEVKGQKIYWGFPFEWKDPNQRPKDFEVLDKWTDLPFAKMLTFVARTDHEPYAKRDDIGIRVSSDLKLPRVTEPQMYLAVALISALIRAEDRWIGSMPKMYSTETSGKHGYVAAYEKHGEHIDFKYIDANFVFVE